MLFNSFAFLAFFVVVHGGYLLLHPRRAPQNALLVAASSVFYGWWDWRFLFLLYGSALFDFMVGLGLGRIALDRPNSHTLRKILITSSVTMNLTVLGFFKYFNFFADGFARLLHSAGLHADQVTLTIILPVGVSFYTFQAMSYTIDVYRGRIQPTRNVLNFLLFVAFYPVLEAGPIERGRELLPQIERERTIRPSHIEAGMWLILWGFFKKMVIADNAAIIVNQVFNGYKQFAGLDLIIGIMAFTIQIYGDFSGYTDIARGIASLMGFDLMLNFRLPYFALSPSDFWQRWHISLSSWLRDYLYIPLGGNRGGELATARNLMITMVLGGLWHGASWTFVIWGAYHGTILILYRIVDRIRGSVGRAIPTARSLANTASQMGLMFALTMVGWALFRVRSVEQAGYMLSNIGFSTSPKTLGFAVQVALFTLPLLVVQVIQHRSRDLLAVPKFGPVRRISIYSALFVGLLIFGVTESMEFIYFQF